MLPPLWSRLLLQVLFICLSGLFSAAELSILSLNENELRPLAEEGDRKAARLLQLLEQGSRTRTTLQLCTWLCILWGAAFAAEGCPAPCPPGYWPNGPSPAPPPELWARSA